MRFIKPTAILDYYDFPQLFVGADVDDDQRLVCCVAVDDGDGGPIYLCTPISTARLAALTDGKIDLRSVFESPEEAIFFPASAASHENVLELHAAGITTVPEDQLPGHGFLVSPGDACDVAGTLNASPISPPMPRTI